MTDPAAIARAEERAKELLVAEWGDHPQWAEVRRRISDGSCDIHSDVVSLSCGIALRAITKALLNGAGGGSGTDAPVALSDQDSEV